MHVLRSVLGLGSVLGLSLLLAAPAGAADWPHWRGPDHNGISRETGWFQSGTPLATAWEAQVGKGYSAVAVVGKRLVTVGNRDNQDVIVCLDARSGAPLWEYSYPCGAGSYPGPRATPAIQDKKVYMMSREGTVVCVNLEDGKEVWSRPVAREMKAASPGWGFSGSPRLHGNLLLLNIGEHGVALNKTTGATVWSSGSGKSGYSTPVVATVNKREILAIFSAPGLIGVDLKSGEALWKHPWKTAHDVNAADPIIHQNQALISSGYGTGGALLNIAGPAPEVVWNNKQLRSHFGTPVLWQNHVYGFDGNTGGGTLKCIEWETGAVKWSYAGFGFGSLMLADGKLIIQSERGELAIAEASPAAYQELAKRSILQGTCWTVPVLANGLIYCRNDAGKLLALSALKP